MKAQRGAAILTAMLTVVLVATLAASSLWQQWRGVEIEAAERSRTQSAWVLTGALDWSRLILREDARKGGADHLGEPWAVPLAQARLSTFLAADRSQSDAADDTQEAFLSGAMVDLQSRLNVTNLVQAGSVNGASEQAFKRLFKHLNLPEYELSTLVDKLRRSQAPAPDAKARTPADADADAPLQPQDVDQLAWLGVSPRSIAVLRPYVTLLPVPTPVNLNTAPAEVIYACVDALELADAHRLVAARNAAPLTTLAQAVSAVGKADAKFSDTLHSVTTKYLEVRGNLQVGATTVQELSLVQRDGPNVKTLTRQRGVTTANAPLQ